MRLLSTYLGMASLMGLLGCAREPLMRGDPLRDSSQTGDDTDDDADHSEEDDAGAELPDAPDGPLVSSGCLPGSYVGKMDCKVNFIGLLDAPNSGEMRLELRPKGSVNVGEEFPILEIAPGGTISGTDAYKGTISATLKGQLDCETGELDGKLVDGAYSNGLASQTYSGDFKGTYSEGPPAALVDGTMTMKSEQLPAVTTCTWSLSRVGSAP